MIEPSFWHAPIMPFGGVQIVTTELLEKGVVYMWKEVASPGIVICGPRFKYLLDIEIERSNAKAKFLLCLPFGARYDRRKLKRVEARAKRRIYLKYKAAGWK